MNMIDFFKNLGKSYKKFNEIPDVVIGSSLTPLACLQGLRIAKYYHAKAIAEIRDLFPESLVSDGVVKKENPVLIPIYYFERKLYEYADDVIFTMAGGYDYIKERGWEEDIPVSKVHYINNGVDLEEFDYNKEHHIIHDLDLINDNIFKVVYTGSIRFTNNLGKILDVARCVKNSNIKFLIWGAGNELQKLRQRVKDEEIGNVIFKGYVEKKYIPYIVSNADLNLIHYSEMPVGRFGVSPNKLFDYMAAGKPILDDRPCNYNPLVECNAGIEIENPTVENIAKAIEDFAHMDKETYSRYCRNARKGAEEYDFKNLTQKLLKIMTGELHK